MPALETLRADRAPRAALAALILLVTVPTATITTLTWRVLKDEQRSAKVRFDELLEARLEDVRLGLEQRVEELGQELARRVVESERSPEYLRALRRSLPIARELFVLSAQGVLTFPPAFDASDEERDFRQRTQAIWDGAATLYEPPEREGWGFFARPGNNDRLPPAARTLLETLNGRTSAGGDSLLDLASRRTEGWVSWYWQDGLHLLFWRRAADGAVIGAEVDRVVLLSRLLAALPERTPVPGRVLIVDAKADVVHGWGRYQPAPDARPNSQRNLAYPLDAWRLQYFADPRAARDVYGGSIHLAAWLGVSAVTLALLLVAGWLWRTSTRAMREARQRVNFVTQVSHELKTPLANIRLYAELLEEDLDEAQTEDPGPVRRLGVILSESQRLSRLIGNILTFTKQQRSQRSRANLSSVSVNDAVQATLEQFRPALEARGLHPELDLGARTPAFAEADGLEQVLANLVGNVEKYAASGGWLKVSTETTPTATLISVEDRGPGIPRRQTERIFEPFYRLSDRIDEGVSGTGIGLSIARALVEGWGGTLRHAVPEGGIGARFVIQLTTSNEEFR